MTTPLKNNKRNLIKIFLIITPKKASVHAAYPYLPDNHSTHRIEMAEEEGAYMLLINCPSCILSSEQGLDLMRESGEPMEFGIFDFSRCFQGLYVRGVMGQRELKWKRGDVASSSPLRTGSPRHPCSSGCYSYPKSLAAADVATNTVAFSDFYIYFASSFIF